MQIQVLTSLLLVNLLSPQDKTLTGHTEVNNGQIILKSLKAKKAAKPKPEKLEAFVPMHISAIGVRYIAGSGAILYVDPASDLYGKVSVGDYLMSTGGKDIEKSAKDLSYFGDEGTIIDVMIFQHGLAVLYKCHRKPIEKFNQKMTAYLRSQLCP